MATIEQLTQQLVSVNENQNDTAKETKKEIKVLSKSVKDLLKFQKDQAKKSGSDLEAEREASRRGVSSGGARATSSSSSSSGPSPIIPPMGSFAIPALIALGASLTGLDAVIRALALPKTFSLFGKTITTFKNTITGIGTTMSVFADSVKNFKIKLPDLPKIRFVDLAGEPYDFSKWTKKIPTIDVTAIRSNVATFFDDIATRVKTFATVPVTAIRSNVVTFFDDIATKINTDLVDKMDDFNAGMSSIKTRVHLFLGGIYLEFDKAWAGASDEFIKHMTNIKTRSLSFFTDIIAKLNLLLPGAGTEGFKTITDKITSIKTGVGGFFDSAKEMVTQKLTLPEAFTNRITAIKTGVGGFFDSTKTFVGDNLKFDMGSKIADIKTSVGTFFDNIPRIKFEMPEGADKIGERLRSVIGTLSGGAGGAEAGTGILGFLNKIFKFMKPLLKPFGYVMSVVMAPVTRIFLGIIDFVTGFYEGFTKDGEATFAKKLINGIEGGVLGFIKGFTDAIDFILFGLPAWIAGKLGFDGVAECLKEFSLTALVDPAWEAVKDFFTTTIPGKMEEWKKAYANFDPMEFITEKFEAVKYFFTDTIPNKIAEFNPLKDFDPMEFITEKFEAVKCFFTDTIPNKIAEFNPLGEFNLTEEIGKKVADMLAMIFDLIPSMEDIKNSLISQVGKLGTVGQSVLEFFGVGVEEDAVPAKIVSNDFTHGYTQEELNARQTKSKLISKTMRTYGTANQDGSISRKRLKAGIAPADDVRLESQAQSDKLGLIADKLERLILLQAMGPQNEGLTSMVNNQTYNYVTAPATSTDDEYGGLINRIRQW